MATLTIHSAADRSPEQIVKHLRSFHVTSARDQAITDAFNRLLTRTDDDTGMVKPVLFTAGSETRGIAVIDGPGGGKTTAISNMLQRHEGLKANRDHGNEPQLSIRVPSPATLKSVGLEIIQSSGYPMSADRRREAWSIWELVRTRLELLNVAVLWVDEAHDLFAKTSHQDKEAILSTIKSLMQGKKPVVVVLSGTERLWDLLQSDPQVSRRFTKVKLPSLSLSGDGEGLQKLLRNYCDEAGLSPPKDSDLIPRLIHASRYRFGRCLEMMINAIEDALRGQQSDVDIQNFADVYAMAEGCELDDNVFLAKHWLDIDPDSFRSAPQVDGKSKSRSNAR